LREFTRLPHVTELVESLAATAYSPYFRAGDVPATAAGCEAALLRSLSTTLHVLWRQAEDDARGWLEVWLAPWDLANIHVVLRAWRSGTPPAALAGLWNATATLSVDTLNELAASGRIEVLTGQLGTRGAMYSEIAAALRGAAGERESRMEDALVAAWARWGARAAANCGNDAATFAAFFGWDIDGRNLRTALRLARDGGSSAAPFLPGGSRLTRVGFLRMAAQARLEDALALLATTPFAPILSGSPAGTTIDLEQIDHRIRRFVLEQSARLYARADPLGVGVLLHLIRLKANEIDNLRLLAYALERRLPAVIIEERLTFAPDQSRHRAR
jgi:vacuolar-type H+-ATPase subunit C/Vma6